METGQEDGTETATEHAAKRKAGRKEADRNEGGGIEAWVCACVCVCVLSKVFKKWQTFWCSQKLIKKDLTREVRKTFYFYIISLLHFYGNVWWTRSTARSKWVWVRVCACMGVSAFDVCVDCRCQKAASKSKSESELRLRLWLELESGNRRVSVARICGLNFNGDWWRLQVTVHVCVSSLSVCVSVCKCAGESLQQARVRLDFWLVLW